MVNNMTVTINPYSTNATQQNINKKDTQQQVTAGVGGAAGINATAQRMASKRGLSRGESLLQKMMSNVSKNTSTIQEGSTLWSKFKYNTHFYANHIMKKMNGLESTKFIGKIIKSPIVKKSASLFGGALAFFVLVTGVNNTIETTTNAAKNYKQQYERFSA